MAKLSAPNKTFFVEAKLLLMDLLVPLLRDHLVSLEPLYYPMFNQIWPHFKNAYLCAAFNIVIYYIVEGWARWNEEYRCLGDSSSAFTLSFIYIISLTLKYELLYSFSLHSSLFVLFTLFSLSNIMSMSLCTTSIPRAFLHREM